MSNVAALVNYFNDFDMLELQVRSGQFDHYDKVYIFDGPYEYTRRLSFDDAEYPKLIYTELGRALQRNRKFVYSYRVWKDEREKRIIAYDSIKEPVIVLHDTDEFFERHAESLRRFIASGFGVASFFCENLFLDGVLPIAKSQQTDQGTLLPLKPYVFKKALVTAESHLDFLWLVGVRQNQADSRLRSNVPTTLGYHFTAMRSRSGQTQKYTFYGALNTEISGGAVTPLETRLRQEVQVGNLKAEEALQVYLQAIPGYIGVPDPEQGLVLKRRVAGSEYLERILSTVARAANRTASGALNLLPGVPARIYLFVGSALRRIEFDCRVRLTVQYWDLCFDSPPVPGGSEEIEGSIVALESNVRAAGHGRLYAIQPLGDVATDPLVRATLS